MDGTDFPVTGGKYKKYYVTNTVTVCRFLFRSPSAIPLKSASATRVPEPLDRA